MTKRPQVVILIGALWPGNEASGPNISIMALCAALADRFDFLIIARDRPFGAAQPMTHGRTWQSVGQARIRYLPVGSFGAIGLSALLRQTPHDLLILNGFFDREFTIPALLARRFGRIRAVPTLLSPRGEFTAGALSLKSGRKRWYRRLVAWLALTRGLHLHVTSEAERADSMAALPGLPVTLVPNIRQLFALPAHVPRAADEPLRAVFLGRISPVKGLDRALMAIAAADVPMIFDIYGPVGDADHWQQCQRLIDALPPQITTRYHGEIANADTPAMLAAHDLMIGPSLSENFGHAIFESLASGTPVLIGDQTPWRRLPTRNAGWDCASGDTDAMAAVIRTCAAKPAAEAAAWRAGARAMAADFVNSHNSVQEMGDLLHGLMMDH